MILTSSKIGAVHSKLRKVLGAVTERSHCRSEREEGHALMSIIDAATADLSFVTTVWSSATPTLKRQGHLYAMCGPTIKLRK